MENFKIKTTQVVSAEIELPQYFKVGDLNFIKVINEDLHLHVSKDDFDIQLYPEIKLKPNRILYWFESHKWDEITEEEFWAVYFETKYLIPGKILIPGKKLAFFFLNYFFNSTLKCWTGVFNCRIQL
jgi:hypothetical protein